MKRYPCEWLLDVGGGNGFVSKHLEDNGTPCVLLEPEEAGVQNALQHGLERVIKGSLQSASFYPNSIPAIGLFDVLEHIEKDQALLEETYRVLQPNGKLFLTVPAYSWLWSGFDEEVGHKRRYTLRRLRKQLESAGFIVLYSSYLFNLLVLPIFVKRRLRFGKRRPYASTLRKQEHLPSQHFFGKVLLRLLKVDHLAITYGLSLPFGSSCFMIAIKDKIEST